MALGTFEFGIPPAHPAKAKTKHRDNRPMASKPLFKRSSCFLNLRTRLFYNLSFRSRIFQIPSFIISPPKHTTGTFLKDYRVVQSKGKTLIVSVIALVNIYLGVGRGTY